MRTSTALVVASVVLASHPAHAQFNSGSTGADGALNPSANLTLTLPATGVFNFTTVNIPGGVILRFTRNATNTPATILAQGDVIIAGTMDVSGSAGGAGSLTGTLLGPNGGAGGPGRSAGGAGANRVVSATGGAVRLVANTVGRNGTIDVNGGDRIGGFFGGSGGFFFNGAGSAGRLRLESFTNTAVLNFVAVPPTTISSSLPNPAVLANAPTLRISSIAGVATPGVAQGSFVTPDITLPAGTTNPVPVTITAANIPVGTVVTLTVQGFVGTVSSVTATLGGTAASSSATASLTIPTNEQTVVSASATFTLLVDH